MKKRLMGLALVTLLGFPAVGMVLIRLFTNQPISVMGRFTAPLWKQLAVGFPLGLALGFAAWGLVSLPFMEASKIKYSKMIAKFDIGWNQILFVSLCAGFGEELLFRGSLQYMLGIWITALIFVALHGYLNPRDWRISVYGVFMTLAIAALGYVTEYLGIYSAVIAHALIDVILFRYMINTGRHEMKREKQEMITSMENHSPPDNDEEKENYIHEFSE